MKKVIFTLFAISLFPLQLLAADVGIDQNLTNRLKGYILLQVEGNGEAWYVDEVSEEKYYLKDGPVAYEALRKFGLGITNDNLAKIPVGMDDRYGPYDADIDNDGLPNKTEEAIGTDPNNPDSDSDGFNDGMEVRNSYNPLGSGKMTIDSALVDQLKGRILLQVESRGEAWYVNPADGKRYYMKDGEVAYQIMKFLSLGITNENLRKIPGGDLIIDKMTFETPADDWLRYGHGNYFFEILYPANWSSQFRLTSPDPDDITSGIVEFGNELQYSVNGTPVFPVTLTIDKNNSGKSAYELALDEGGSIKVIEIGDEVAAQSIKDSGIKTYISKFGNVYVISTPTLDDSDDNEEVVRIYNIMLGTFNLD